jgi:tartrate-resistant acid phosphatase type 5
VLLVRRWRFWLLAWVVLLAACGSQPALTAGKPTPASPVPTPPATATAVPVKESTVEPQSTPSVIPPGPPSPVASSARPSPAVAPSSTPRSSPTPPTPGPTTVAPTRTLASATPSPELAVTTPAPQATEEQRHAGVVRIAVIGDYGLATPAEADVALLIKSWRPDLIITTGDNNYPIGSPDTIDLNVGQFYHDFIASYSGTYGSGAEQNRFFPTLGNHDWMDSGAQAYLDYFTLPGNERYYDVAWGPVHLFAVDSMPGEPDGIDASSRQASWLRQSLAAATEPWKLVYMHHPPFSSGPHGSTPAMQWPYGEWGATAVLAGHDHIYERIVRDGTVYFVNGLGGSVRYDVGNPVKGSQVRFSADFGALFIDADPQQITFRFVTRAGDQVDEYTITR